MEFHPPEELRGQVVTLRRYRLDDLYALKAATAASLDNLRPWMPWAQAPPTDESVLAFLQPSAEQFGGTAEANYAITMKTSGDYVGSCGLMPRVGPGALEIGYWVHSGYLRLGIATEATSLVANAALALPEIKRVEIHCDEANIASRTIPSRLGFQLARIEPKEIEAPGEVGRSMIWVTEQAV